MADIPQFPAYLDPLLNYLDEYLPPELSSFLTSFVSHSAALLTALLSLVSSFIAAKPWEWDAQTIIPPLISFLAAYLALVSLYRTTSWVFRTTFWLIKWGSIFGLVVAGLSWYTGTHEVNGRGTGLVSSLGAVLLSALNGNAYDGAGTRFPESTSRTSKHRTQKPWKSFNNQRQEDKSQRDNDAQRIMSDIAAVANRILVEGGWWDVAKGIFTQPDSQSDGASRTNKRRRSDQSRR